VNTATVSTNEASTWPVRYLCSVFTLFYADAASILKPEREIRNAKMKCFANAICALCFAFGRLAAESAVFTAPFGLVFRIEA
jgi:hypothetical protein